MDVKKTGKKVLNALIIAAIAGAIGGRFYYVITHDTPAKQKQQTASHTKEELDTLYAAQLVKNREAVDEEWDYVTDSNESVGTLYASFSSSKDVGYSYIDLDGNGMEELIIMPKEGKPANKGQILALYEYDQETEQAKLLLHSETLTPAYLTEDSYIIRYSNQPTETVCSYYKLNDASPEEMEFIEAWVQDKSTGSSVYYHTYTDPANKAGREEIQEIEKTTIAAKYVQIKNAQYSLADTTDLDTLVPEEQES